MNVGFHFLFGFFRKKSFNNITKSLSFFLKRSMEMYRSWEHFFIAIIESLEFRCLLHYSNFVLCHQSILKSNMESKKCLTYRKSGKKTLEIERKLKICKKIFDHPYIYNTATEEKNMWRRTAKKLMQFSKNSSLLEKYFKINWFFLFSSTKLDFWKKIMCWDIFNNGILIHYRYRIYLI